MLLWTAILAARLGLYSLQPEFHGRLALTIVPHAFASAALLGPVWHLLVFSFSPRRHSESDVSSCCLHGHFMQELATFK